MRALPSLLWQILLLGCFTQAAAKQPRALQGNIGFEQNIGQFGSQSRFVASVEGHDVALHDASIAITPRDDRNSAVRIRFRVDEDSLTAPVGVNQSAAKHYYPGRDAAVWITGAPVFQQVLVGSILPGVALRYHSERGPLEFDFIVAAGTDPDSIGFDIAGADLLELDDHGNLVLTYGDHQLQLATPYVYQDIDGIKKDIDAGYRIEGSRVSFRIASYDQRRTLVIDPVLEFSTYHGGESQDAGLSVAAHPDGGLIVAGSTASLAFPAENVLLGGEDGFVSRYDPQGRLVFTTYFGGLRNQANAGQSGKPGKPNGKGAGQESVQAVTVDGEGTVYVAGQTSSQSQFPVKSAFQPEFGGGISDGFVSVFGADGSLLRSTYLGGRLEDALTAIDIRDDTLWVGGHARSRDMPVTDNAVQAANAGGFDLYVAALTSDGHLDYGTYLGGRKDDRVAGMAVSASQVFIAGQTHSNQDFPGVPDTGSRRVNDPAAYALALTPGATEVDFSLVVNGSGDDRFNDVAVTPAGLALAGTTTSPDLQPVGTTGAFGGQADGLFATVDLTGELTHLAYLGGSGEDGLNAASYDGSNLWLAGHSGSAMPLLDPIDDQQVGREGYLLALDPASPTIRFATYFGGDGSDSIVDIDVAGSSIVLTGSTDSASGFVLARPTQPIYAGQGDAFVARITSNSPPVITSEPVDEAERAEPYLYQVLAEDEDDDSLTYSLVQAPDGMVIDASTGEISFTPQAIGLFEVEVEVTDGTATDNQTFTLSVVDTIAPQITIIEPVDGLVTSAAEVNISGSVDEPATITINGQFVDLAESFDLAVMLSEGDNTITVAAVDSSGNESTESIDVVLDTTPPVITLTLPQDGVVTNVLAVGVQGRLNEPGTVVINGQGVVVGSDLLFSEVIALGQEGANVIEVIAQDEVGNQSAVTRTVVRDTIPPTVVIDSPVQGALLNVNPLSVSGTVDGAAIVTVNGVASQITGALFQSTVPVQQGTVTLTAVAVDIAGNTASASTTVGVDLTAPQINPSAIHRSDSSGGVVMVSGASGATESGAMLTLVNTRTGIKAIAVATSNGSFAVDIAALSTDTLQIHATDLAGNISNVLALAAPSPSTLTLNPIGNIEAPLGSLTIFAVTANDSDDNPVTLLVEPRLPDNATLDTVTGEFRFTPAPDQVGEHQLTIVARTQTQRVSEDITITVTSEAVATAFTSRLLDATALAQGELIPIVGATVTFLGSGVVTQSDAGGYFTLSNLPDGAEVIDINSATAQPGPGGQTYSSFREKLHLVPGVKNTIERPISLPAIDADSLTTVDPGTTTTVFNPNLGMVLTVPPGSAVNEDGTPFTGQLSISPVPEGFAPVAMPEGLVPGQLVTIQPVGVRFAQPAPLSFPNAGDLPENARVDLISLNPDTGQFEPVGVNEVSADGDRLETIEGGVRQADWHFWRTRFANLEVAQSQDFNCENDCLQAGSTFNSASGNLTTAFELPAYRSLEQERRVRFIYQSRRSSNDIVAPLRFAAERFQGGPGGIRVFGSIDGIGLGGGLMSGFPLVRPIDPTTGSPLDAYNAIHSDRVELPTGSYDLALSISAIYPGSTDTRCVYFVNPLCIEFKTFTTPGSVFATTLQDTIVVEDEVASPFGAGWMIEGLNRLAINPNASVSLVSPVGRMITYEPVTEAIETGALDYIAPDGEFSTLARLASNHYQHTTVTGDVSEYDETGLLRTRTDRNGNVTRYDYTDGRVTTITDPVGRQTTFDYDINGRIDSITDPAGRVTRFETDALGNLTRVTFPDDSFRAFSYDEHLMTQRRDERGFATRYDYDGIGRITRAILPDGTERALAAQATVRVIKLGETTAAAQAAINGYLANGNATDRAFIRDTLPAPVTGTRPGAGFTNGRGHSSARRTGPLGYLIEHVDEIGRVTIHERDADGNPVTTTRPNTSIVNRTFDDRGNVLSIEEAFNNARTAMTYDDFSLLTSIRNPRDHTTSIERDSSGNPIRIINELGHTTHLDYTREGLLQRLETPNGLVSEFIYNSAGLLQTRTDTPAPGTPGNVRVTRHTYDDAGLLATITTPDNITLTFTYDDRSRVTTVTDNLNQVITFTYDDVGNITRTATNNADGSLALRVDSVFDHRNRLIQTASPHTDVEDSIVQLVLDNNDNLQALIDSKNQRSDNVYDEVNRLSTSTHRLDGDTTFEYDDLDRVTRVIAPNGVITQYTYDLLGRRTSEVSSDRGTLTFAYDLANNLTRVTDARGVIMDMTYDALERLTSKTFSSVIPGKDEDVQYGYDTCDSGIGRLCTRTDESGITSFTYDSFGNVTSSVRASSGTTFAQTYEYDDGDNVVAMTMPSGRAVTYDRDDLRRLAGINAEVNGSSQAVVSNIEYRADNQVTRRLFGNGVIDTRGYDLQGRLTHQQLNGGMLDDRQYSYDKNSNITAITINGITHNYGYDALDRLTEELINTQGRSFAYDANDNRLLATTVTATDTNAEDYRYAASSNRLVQRSTLVDAADPVPDIDRTLVYNAAGRLFQVVSGGGVTAEYIYNDNGQRTRKTVFDGQGGSTTTVYHYDLAGHLVSETTPTGESIKDYLWQENLMPVAQIDVNEFGNDQITHLHTDHLLTARVATDASQSIIWRWQGEAFGGDVPDALAGVVINLRFPGQYFDQETNLHYNHFRYYDAQVGRYITSDPIGLTGDRNSYSYSLQGPTRNIDPSGQIVPILIVAIAGGAANAASVALADSNASGSDIARSFLVGATVGAVTAAATPILAASTASFFATAAVAGGTSGAATAGITELALGGSVTQAANAALVGGAIGVVTGGFGNTTALAQALRASGNRVQRINRGNLVGNLAAAEASIALNLTVCVPWE